MKKIFDFKSSNTENFILDKILNFIEKKIHNFVVALLLTIVVGVSMIGLFIGFFVMPFITYSSTVLKIVFSVLWGISCVVFVCATIDQYKQEKKDEKWSFITTSVCLIIFFGLCLINNNYYHLGDWWQIAIVVAMGLYTALMIYWFIKELIKNPKGTLSALLMGVLFVFGFLCILSSSLNSLEMDLRKEMLIVGTICIAFPVIAILIAKILKISKAEKVLEYGSLIIICILLLMGISYVISFLNPNVDGYQTFVTLFASFIGGGLTLIGVAWTIRREAKNRQEDFDKREQERKEEERKKAIPYLRVSESKNEYKSSFVVDIQVKQKKNGILQGTMYLFTINESIFIFKGAIIDGKLYEVGERLLSKENQILFVYNKYEVESVEILGCDALGNYYKYKYLDKYLDMPKELTKEEMEALYKND